MTTARRVNKIKVCANPACGIEFTPPRRGTWKYCTTACWNEADPGRSRIPRNPPVDPEEVAGAEDAAETRVLVLESFVRKLSGSDSTIEDARELQVLSEAVVAALVVRDRLKGRAWADFTGPLDLSDETIRRHYDLPEGTRRRA